MIRLIVFILGMLASRLATADSGALVIVGGGNTPPEAHRKLVEFGGGTQARVVIVPFASGQTNAGESSIVAFRPFKPQSIEVLPETNRLAARAALERATAIWFPGGEQQRLMDKLGALNLLELIRTRHAQGAAVGGTSAGAAVMSKTMIAGSGKKPDDPPLITTGLGLWPEVIVDQHFVKRGRESRLRRAVALHPQLTGVGIDEGTAVIVRAEVFEVLGSSTVTMIEAREAGAAPKMTVFSASQRFSFTNKQPATSP
jgi:cyanophycinase